MPRRRTWSTNPQDSSEPPESTPDSDPVQVVDDANAHVLDNLDEDLADFEVDSAIQEDLDDFDEVDEEADLEAELDGELDGDIYEDSELRPRRRSRRRWNEPEDEDEDDTEDMGLHLFSHEPFETTFGSRGRFGELGELDEDDGVDNEDDEEEDEEEDDGDAGIHRLLEMHRRLRRMPRDGSGDGADDDADGEAEFEDLRRNPLLQALRGAFPSEGGFSDFGHLEVMGPRLRNVMSQLKSNEEAVIISALEDLSSILLMPEGGFVALAVFPVNSVARSLVNLLRASENIEILVMTARAMAQLVDNGFDGAVRALIVAGIIPVLRTRFENIGYIDLVEQLIRVVKPVAAVEPKLVLESGCLLPCVSFLDFFGSYIQKQILGAVDLCAHAVSPTTVGPARDLLTALPSPPSELIVGTLCQLVSAIAKRSPPDADLREVVSQTMWETLVSHISAQTPHVARVLRACSHIAARCPEYVQSRPALASLVAATLTQGSKDSFSALLATPKETLFSGLKLLQVLLPPPPPIGPFVGPYRKSSSSEVVPIASDTLHEYALSAIPTAMAVYGASTNTPVRQLALLVIVQTAAANPTKFPQLVRELQLAPFAAQVVAEGADSLALTVGGLDLAWDLAKDPELLIELSLTGITADLEELSGPAEPSGSYSPTDDLKPVAEYMASRILGMLRTQQVEGDYSTLLESVRAGLINSAELAAAPLPELLRAGLLDAFQDAGEAALRRHLGSQLVNILQGAIGRLERFPLQLSPGHSVPALANVLGRSISLRVSERNNSSNGWTLSVPAVASLRAIEEFIRGRFSSHSIIETDSTLANYAFYAGDERVPSDISVLKAVHDQLNHGSAGHHQIPQLQFERVAEREAPAEQPEPDLSRHGELGKAITLLAVLANENEARNGPVPWAAFQNSKLTTKLTRQMADALIVAASMLPQWTFDTVMQAPFLYPLRTRLQFVQLTSFGLGRNLRLLRQMENRDADEDDGGGEPDDDDRVLGRHRRQKYRLARDKLLEGSLRLLEMSCKNPAVLDVMFYNEEGTGRGPTQEFFAIASRELSRIDLGIWRETPMGLFPSPEAPNEYGLRLFEGIGRLMSRALLDKRILDFRLNPAFFAVVLGSPTNLETVRRVDSQLAASLELILNSSPSDIIDMGLDFVLPGTGVELVPNGANLDVTPENAGDFVACVVDRVVGKGIRQQLDAFKRGFSSTIPVSALRAFTTDELVALCGAGRAEDWSEEALIEAFRADHGYSMQSVPVKSLVRVLASFDEAERRKFLMFATGSPHLPIGGFKALNPPFTVVVKTPENSLFGNDQYLPSVMTCVNYLKLPPYSSEDVMRAQLKLAMSEGSESFPLS